MTSVIYFKLKNAIQQQQLNFDGSVIQIGDVKRLVAQKQGLGPEGAAEITLYDPNTNEEYTDVGKVIPRNTLVLVKRAPATKFKPLLAGDGAAAAAAPGGQPSGAQQGAAPASAAEAGEFGGDYYSQQPVVGEEETRALQSLLQGTAANWQREVRQASFRGRGRGRGGRGGAPPDYRCPRCEAVGVHWVQDCPTQGDPSFDRKRIRPPVGIPMTRLARSQEGGLVLPDGQTGTLVANEDAFAREILGLGLANGSPMQAAGQAEPLLALEDKSTVEAAAAAAAAAAATAAAPAMVAPAVFPAAPRMMEAPPVLLAPPPKLAGEEELGKPATAAAVGAAFFETFTRAGLLPRGPAEFVVKAYNIDEPLPRSEFERVQDKYRRQYNMPPLRRAARPRSRERERDRSHSKRRSRSRSAERTRSKRRTRSPEGTRKRDRSSDRTKKEDGSKREGGSRREGAERKHDKERSKDKDKDKERDADRRRGSRRSGSLEGASRVKSEAAEAASKAVEDDRWQTAGAPGVEDAPGGAAGAPEPADARNLSPDTAAAPAAASEQARHQLDVLPGCEPELDYGSEVEDAAPPAAPVSGPAAPAAAAAASTDRPRSEREKKSGRERRDRDKRERRDKEKVHRSDDKDKEQREKERHRDKERAKRHASDRERRREPEKGKEGGRETKRARPDERSRDAKREKK